MTSGFVLSLNTYEHGQTYTSVLRKSSSLDSTLNLARRLITVLDVNADWIMTIESDDRKETYLTIKNSYYDRMTISGTANAITSVIR